MEGFFKNGGVFKIWRRFFGGVFNSRRIGGVLEAFYFFGGVFLEAFFLEAHWRRFFGGVFLEAFFFGGVLFYLEAFYIATLK